MLGAGRVCCVGVVVPRWVFTGIGGCVLSVSGWCVGGVEMTEQDVRLLDELLERLGE